MTAGRCRRGSTPLFCATWHTCREAGERQRRLDQWAERYQKPRETPKVRPVSWDAQP